MQIVLWAAVIASVAILAIGCREWIKGRGRYLVLATVPNLALSAGMLLGEAHPAWRYVCFAVSFVFVTYAFITFRKAIRWRSPTLLSAGAAILLIVITEVAADVIGGVPRPIVLALLWAVGAATVLFIVSMFWEMKNLLRKSGPTA